MTYLYFSQNHFEMTEQFANTYKKADAEMTATYEPFMKILSDANQKKLLLEAQPAWIIYKETHCKAIAYLYEGGSMKPMIYCDCLADITQERAKQLKWYFDNN